MDLTKLRTYDVSVIPGLNFHPASVVLVALSNLRIETSRSGNRVSFPRESSPTANNSRYDYNWVGIQKTGVVNSLWLMMSHRQMPKQPPLNPPASELTREVANLTERKILHMSRLDYTSYEVCFHLGNIPTLVAHTFAFFMLLLSRWNTGHI